MVRVRQTPPQKAWKSPFYFRIDLQIVKRGPGMEPLRSFQVQNCSADSSIRGRLSLRTPPVPVAGHVVAGRLCLKVWMRRPVSSTRG
jgi:hypothetical protein